VAIPEERNVAQKQAENKLNVRVCMKMQRMWNMKCLLISVVTGATGIVTRGLKKDLEAIPGKH
jgi:hypothetical protein